MIKKTLLLVMLVFGMNSFAIAGDQGSSTSERPSCG